MRVPNGMDGVAGLTQVPIEVGQTFKYEYTLPAAGTFMYHSHKDDMTQGAMGMMGMFVVHPRDAGESPGRPATTASCSASGGSTPARAGRSRPR